MLFRTHPKHTYSPVEQSGGQMPVVEDLDGRIELHKDTN